VNYTWDNKIAFSHLFLKDWDTSREITSYPPTTGPLAVYTKEDFYQYIDFAVKRVRTNPSFRIFKISKSFEISKPGLFFSSGRLRIWQSVRTFTRRWTTQWERLVCAWSSMRTEQPFSASTRATSSLGGRRKSASQSS
jgi:hypothetical protein